VSFESTPSTELTVNVVSSFVEPVSFVAVGVGLSTVQTKVSSIVPPFPSFAVTVTLYGPD